jgi:ABC-type Fe3+/spermidine/putrescine transport system ATPase subunit
MLNAKIKKEFRTNGRVTFALDASFVVQQGITVLFGPSGSGKTTILRSIAGIVVPDEGRSNWVSASTLIRRLGPTYRSSAEELGSSSRITCCFRI